MSVNKAAVIAVMLVIVGIVGGLVVNFYNQPAVDSVTIFILDDFSRTGELTTGQQVSHGEIVKQVITAEVPEVTVIPYSVVGSEGAIDQEFYFAGLSRVGRYAGSHPKQRVIVNISLSFAGDDKVHRRLIQQLNRQRVKVVAAAGNDDADRPVYPAGYQKVIAVANANREEKLADSNYGVYVDIAAPGSAAHISRDYYSGGVGIKTLQAEGTSFSAPRVVGLLAELVINRPELSLEEAWQIIADTAVPIASQHYQAGDLGAGIIDKTQALGQVISGYQLKRRLALTLGLGLVLALILGLLVKYRIAGIFFILLLFLVGFPLLLLTGQQLRWGTAQAVEWAVEQDLGLLTVVSMLGSVAAGLLFTTGKQSKLMISYLVLLAGGLVIAVQLSFLSFIPWLLWGWTAVLFGLEWGLSFYLQRCNKPETLLKFSCCPSHRINDLLKNKLVDYSGQLLPVLKQVLHQGNIAQQILSIEVLAERGTDKAQELIQQQLGTSSSRVGQAAVRALLEFSPAPVGIILVFAEEYNLAADKLRDWWPQISESEVENLVELTQHDEQAVAELAVDILGRLETERAINTAVNRIKAALKDNNSADKEVLLEVLIQLGTPAEAALPEVINIIRQEEAVWLRYKALRALKSIAVQPEQFMNLFEELQADEEELMRLEAEGIKEEIVE